jgi:hypothetical protein
MTPYRSPATRPKVVTFGDAGPARVLGAAGLVLLILGVILWIGWTPWALLLAMLGIRVVHSAKWGTLELSREHGCLIVAIRWGLLPLRPVHVPLGDLVTIEIVEVPVGGRSRALEPELTLSLGRGRRVPLRRGDIQGLEADRAAIADFLGEHDLLKAR